MSDASEPTERKHSGLIPFQPGQSGNPAGRPKGARNKLGEDFIRALADDFAEHGKTVIETVRTEKPAEYVKVVASLLPKQVEIKEGTFDGLSDDDLADALAAVRALRGAGAGAGAGSEDAGGSQPAAGLFPVH